MLNNMLNRNPILVLAFEPRTKKTKIETPFFGRMCFKTAFETVMWHTEFTERELNFIFYKMLCEGAAN